MMLMPVYMSYTPACVCALQLVGFAYLTWWELSWDVMEPVAYMLSLFYSLIAYMYFLWTRSYFEQKDFGDYCECVADAASAKWGTCCSWLHTPVPITCCI
jgi:hypothetical protein